LTAHNGSRRQSH